MKINYPSITSFKQHVELKDYRPKTKKEYVRYVCKLAKHFQCDPATLGEDQIRQYFLFLRQHKHCKRTAAPPAMTTHYTHRFERGARGKFPCVIGAVLSGPLKSALFQVTRAPSGCRFAIKTAQNGAETDSRKAQGKL